mmetsp:Transcript_13660/g.24669  ORF Transcript_13660/g.24669 Transcript_13660/m.24669 type:complete len:221 (-) Transcript_13660:231-893(-)
MASLDASATRTMSMKMNVDGFYREISRRLEANMQDLEIINKDFDKKAKMAMGALEATNMMAMNMHARTKNTAESGAGPAAPTTGLTISPEAPPSPKSNANTEGKDETNPAIEQNQAALADDDNLRQEDPENINDLATASGSGGSDALIDQFSSMKVMGIGLSKLLKDDYFGSTGPVVEATTSNVESRKSFKPMTSLYSKYASELREDLAAMMTITAPDIP